jgi:glucosamine-6-phosphate deaminase
VIHAASLAALAAAAADLIAEHARRKPDLVLALPTGNSPLGLYAELIERSRAGRLNLGAARAVNLDEFCGLPRTDPHSYAAFLDQHLLGPLKWPPAQLRLLRGDAPDVEAECREVDLQVGTWGGIDVCILGLGMNGHIAFNEPGSSWDERTHLVQLSPVTLAAQAAQAKTPWRIPAQGITLGVRNLIEARHILLIIAGARKQVAKEALYRGAKDRAWPVTSLLGHASLTVLELCSSSILP